MFLMNHRLVPVFAALCSPEADREAFRGQFDGATLEAATAALWGAFADFFRRHPISLRVRADGPAAVMAAMGEAIRAAATPSPGATS